MFFSTDVLSLKANTGLGVVWLAGTLGQRSQARRLLRRDYCSVDITTACSYLMAPPEPLSLRLSASLMVGVVRVYGQQCNFCYGDATALYGKLEQSLLDGIVSVTGNSNASGAKAGELDLPVQRAKHDAITINGGNVNMPNENDISSGNVWSELDKYRTAVARTPEVERGRQLSSAGAGGTNKSDSTNTAIPGRITSTPLQFGADDEGLLRELFGDITDLQQDLQTPHSEDTLLSGIFHAPTHPGSLLDVPDTITVTRPRRRPQVAHIDDPTMLTREEMFQERHIENAMQSEHPHLDIVLCLKGQSVDLGVPHQAWDVLQVNASMVVPLVPKKRRRSSGASSNNTQATVSTQSDPPQSSPKLPFIDFQEDLIMPWSEPISDHQPSDQHKARSSTTSRDSMGFLRFLDTHDPSKPTFHFDDIFPPHQTSRRVVARAFHNVLQAAGDGRLAVNQICPFGRITIMHH